MGQGRAVAAQGVSALQAAAGFAAGGPGRQGAGGRGVFPGCPPLPWPGQAPTTGGDGITARAQCSGA
eukprot:2512558-Alexandrium_andersonii.AAC.1